VKRVASTDCWRDPLRSPLTRVSVYHHVNPRPRKLDYALKCTGEQSAVLFSLCGLNLTRNSLRRRPAQARGDMTTQKNARGGGLAVTTRKHHPRAFDARSEREFASFTEHFNFTRGVGRGEADICNDSCHMYLPLQGRNRQHRNISKRKRSGGEALMSPCEGGCVGRDQVVNKTATCCLKNHYKRTIATCPEKFPVISPHGKIVIFM